MKSQRNNGKFKGEASRTIRLAPLAKQTGNRRRCLFRLLALLSPVLLVLLVEATLRLGGYGFSTCFFLERIENGRRVLVENPKFGWRFFPPTVARSPLPFSSEIPKPSGTVRVLVLGESAAMGDPEPSYGLARQLEKMLQSRHPDKKIEVLNVAMTAINSHVIREIAIDCIRCEADAWVLYAGNNEVVGPFGAGTVFGRQAAALRFVRAELAFKQTRFGQLLTTLRRGKREPMEWQGMELFLQQQVRANDPRMNRVYRNFEENLASVIYCGREAGAKVVISTLGVNLDDCPPFASKHREGIPPEESAEWERNFSQGGIAESRGLYAEALTAYEAAMRIDSEFAELAYRMGRCHSRLKQGQNAGGYFQLARDLDTLRFRADSRINAITRETALREQVRLVDIEQMLLTGSNALSGAELFYDHVHFNFKGNHQLASALMPALETEIFGSVATEPMPEVKEIAGLLAFSPWDQRRILEEMRARLQQPPFTYQLNSKQRDEQLVKTLEQMISPPAESMALYRAAVARDPSDWSLHANFAALLEAADDSPGARAQWAEASRLMPHIADPWFHLGNLAHSEGLADEANQYFREALKQKPDSTEALNGLGLNFSDRGKSDEALKQFEAALQIDPRFSAARVNMALELSKRGHTAGAASQYKRVLEADTNNVPSRINLGKLLADQGRLGQAIEYYREAIQLQADNAIAHFNLGNALATQGHHQEALEHYQLATLQQPGFVEARYSLAMELIHEGKQAEALPHLAEVTRLKPNHVEAHFNYGIALAREKRFSEANEQFRETLRLQPNHPAARKALDRGLQMMRQ